MIVGIDIEAAAVGTAGIARYVTGLVGGILDHPQDIEELHLFSPHRISKFDHPLVRWHLHGKSPRAWRTALLSSHLGLGHPLADTQYLDVYHATDLVFPIQSSRIGSIVVTVHDLTPITHRATHGLIHSLATQIFYHILVRCQHQVITPSLHVRNSVLLKYY